MSSLRYYVHDFGLINLFRLKKHVTHLRRLGIAHRSRMSVLELMIKAKLSHISNNFNWNFSFGKGTTSLWNYIKITDK